MGVRSKISSFIRLNKDKLVDVKRNELSDESFEGIEMEARKVINLLRYTKKSGSAYNANEFEIGYHSVQLGDLFLKGQRNPGERLATLDFDFTGKKVIDLGCNQGGMLREIADKTAYGLGVDYDSRMINVANRIKRFNGIKNLDYYVLDLDNEDINLIKDFSSEDSFDIVFMLSIAVWVSKWKELVQFANSIAPYILFETNGTSEQQTDQIEYLKKTYSIVKLISERSEDDPGQKMRQLFICNN
jgi:SAM-dependent methyltransferase